MTEKYIYADVEKPFHFWVREGQRWILRDARAPRDDAAHGAASGGARQVSTGQGPAGR